MLQKNARISSADYRRPSDLTLDLHFPCPVPTKPGIHRTAHLRCVQYHPSIAIPPRPRHGSSTIMDANPLFLNRGSVYIERRYGTRPPP